MYSYLQTQYGNLTEVSDNPLRRIFVLIHGIEVKGVEVDLLTRCHHYSNTKDVIAIKFYCCQTYYPCHSCHDTITDHSPMLWPADKFDEKAILCGVCGLEMSISDYMKSNFTCSNCKADFNPRCQNHYRLYFEVGSCLEVGL